MKISLSIVAVGHTLRAFPYEGSSTSESSEGGFAKIAPSFFFFFFIVSGTLFLGWVFCVYFLCVFFLGGGWGEGVMGTPRVVIR